MATLSIGSAKGGCGKTTTAILLSAELALNHSYKVTLLDSDVNQHASAHPLLVAVFRTRHGD